MIGTLLTFFAVAVVTLIVAGVVLSIDFHKIGTRDQVPTATRAQKLTQTVSPENELAPHCDGSTFGGHAFTAWFSRKVARN